MYGFREDFDFKNRFMKQEKVEYKGNKYTVSTVDLGLDHSFDGGKPLYYETMIFTTEGRNFLDYQDRYSTEEEALAGHERTKIKLLNGTLDKML